MACWKVALVRLMSWSARYARSKYSKRMLRCRALLGIRALLLFWPAKPSTTTRPNGATQSQVSSLILPSARQSRTRSTPRLACQLLDTYLERPTLGPKRYENAGDYVQALEERAFLHSHR